MSRNTFRIPDNLNIPTKFFGRFTAKDLVRISIPLLAAWLLTSDSSLSITTVLILLISAAVSGVWYGFRPYNQTLDHHLFHFLRFQYQTQRDREEPDVEVNSDHVVVDEESVVGFIQVEPTNLEMKTEAEQAALHNVHEKLLNTVSYPVTVHSRQKEVDLEQYQQRIEDNAEDSVLKTDYLRQLQALGENGLITTDHLIVLRVHQDTTQWLQQNLPEWIPVQHETDPEVENLVNELDSRIYEIIDAINTADLTPRRITGQELEETSLKASLQPFNPTWEQSNTAVDDTGEHQYPVTITELPSRVDLGWPLHLLRVDGQVDITQVIRPRSPAKASKKLQRISEKLNAEIDSLLHQGYTGTQKLEALLDDVEWFLNLLADRRSQPVDYAAYITAHHSNQRRAEQTFQQVINRLETLQIDYQQPVFQTDQAFHTHNPLHTDQLDETRLMPSSSAAAGFPFGTQKTKQDQGVIFGFEHTIQSPVLLDRFQWSSHSMARMGMVGSGKSYASKIELLRAYLAYNNPRIIIVDPKQEYSNLTRSLNGETLTLSESQSLDLGESDVINLTVKDRGQKENTQQLVDAVREIYRFTSNDARQTIVLIDEARILLNHNEGRDVLNQFVLEARDTNTAVTLVTQNASHFTHHRKGREILDNMPGKVFMRHDRVPDSVTDYFDLSQREVQKLHELKTGTDSDYSEALLKVTGRLDTQVQIHSTPQENAVIQAGENGGEDN